MIFYFLWVDFLQLPLLLSLSVCNKLQLRSQLLDIIASNFLFKLFQKSKFYLDARSII